MRGARPGAAVIVLYNLLYWPYLLGSCAVLFAPALVIYLATFAWDRRLRILHRYTCFWGAHYLVWAPLVRVRVEGRENIAKDRAYVYVSNHQSMVDILAVFATGLDFKWVSKIENFFVPFIGWNMILNGHIALRRGHLPGILRMYRRSLAALGRGDSLFVFPEGTRSPDGEIKSFFRGAFCLSARTRAPVVPIVIQGTGSILPKSSFRIAPYPVTIRILPPVDPADFAYDDARLREEVRARMIAELARLRAEG